MPDLPFLAKYGRGETSNSASVTCFKCNQQDHYITQCLTNDRGKALAASSIMSDVQQVTTRSKSQTMKWEIQDEVRQAAKERIDKANKTNVYRMHTEMKDITIGAPSPTQPNVSLADDPVWQTLTSSQISMPLHKLLQLLSCFVNHERQPNLTTRQPCRARDWPTPHGIPKPHGENRHQRTRHSWMHHRRRFQCQRNQ